MRTLVLTAVLLLSLSLAMQSTPQSTLPGKSAAATPTAARQAAQSSEDSRQSPGRAETPTSPQSSTPPAPDPARLRADLTKMRALLRQMQVNLAFAQAGDTPMKHQFELEIDMWNLLISHMESELQAATTAAPPPKP